MDLFVSKSSCRKNDALPKDAKAKDWTDTVVEICEGIWEIVSWCLRVILVICFVGIVFDILRDIFGGSD